MSLKVLVTGGAGFIGSHVVDLLVKKGCTVRILDDLSSGAFRNIANHVANDRANFIHGSIVDQDVVAKALHGIDRVVHLAAIVSVPFSIAYPELTYDVNVHGTEVLLDQCVEKGVERFVFASSCAVYGEPSYLPIDEVHPTVPLSPYAETKLMAEKLCLKGYDRVGLNAAVLRIFNVYGQRQASNDYPGVISSFMERLTGRVPLIINGDGLQTRDFVHVSDVSEGVWLALNSASEGVFNIASGKQVRIRELAEVMARLVNIEEPELVFVSPRKGDVRNSYGDYSKARKKLGYQPKKNLLEGLGELLEDIEVVEVLN